VGLFGLAGFDTVGLKRETHPVCDERLGPLVRELADPVGRRRDWP